MKTSKRVSMGIFNEIELRIQKLENVECVIFNDSKREKNLYEVKKKIFK
ncbi:hypothetical protein ACFO6R_16125 [Eubacterium multiforme]|uniref:Uncharacterized protein n=1 Tax=Eubacterium multiforme TaxID=83339 RepID=A0ABT9UTK8_9FIRM|nr:hypothetical protein [Eubacterium multiforme]MDQ0149609.1 hypothetical protein [Eubacterium multiforme]